MYAACSPNFPRLQGERKLDQARVGLRIRVGGGKQRQIQTFTYTCKGGGGGGGDAFEGLIMNVEFCKDNYGSSKEMRYF